MISVSAPGKLVLLGEYAVLAGAPAIAMAVDRRAKVTMKAKGSDSSAEKASEGTARLSAKANHGLSSSLSPGKPFPFKVRRHAIHWLSHDGQHPIQRVFSHGASKKLLKYLETSGPRTIHLDTRAFYQGTQGTKLGLGSSAALSLALKALDQESLDMAQAMAAHHSNQGNQGSGIDVACSFYGGIIRFQQKASGNPSLEPLPLLPEWHWCCIWSGQSASTPQMVKRWQHWARENSKSWQDLLESAGEISQTGINALKQGQTGSWVRQIKAYGQWMQTLEKYSGIPIVTKVHRELGKIALTYGVGYKPSGAGGGDVGIAFAHEAEQIKRLSERAADEGHLVVPLGSDTRGLSLEKE